MCQKVLFLTLLLISINVYSVFHELRREGNIICYKDREGTIHNRKASEMGYKSIRQLKIIKTAYSLSFGFLVEFSFEGENKELKKHHIKEIKKQKTKTYYLFYNLGKIHPMGNFSFTLKNRDAFCRLFTQEIEENKTCAQCLQTKQGVFHVFVKVTQQHPQMCDQCYNEVMELPDACIYD